MTKRNKIILGTGIAVAAVAALLATVLNKRWWGRRITAKWDVVTAGPDVPANNPWVVYGPDFAKWSIPELFEAWKNGVQGWYPKGQRPDVPTDPEFVEE